MKHRILAGCSSILGIVIAGSSLGQDFNLQDFDSTSLGPWSDVSDTVTGVSKVPNGSITIDGTFDAAEYGGIPGVTVTPGDNAWILDFPGDRQWDGPEDSSFTFWLAHDDDNLYVAVSAKDDVVTSDDENAAFWKDDSIEIITDVLNDRYDNNTDNSNDPYGGHNYFNFLGRFSRWDDTTDERIEGAWATAVEWTYGEDGDVYGMGGEVDGGWNLEVRMSKRMFEDPDAGNKLQDGYSMGFNIGLDDDDKFGIGTDGDGSRSQDLEIQYFWANRERVLGWGEAEKEFFDELALSYFAYETDPFYEHGVNSAGRLSHGGTGEIVFGFDQVGGVARPKLLFLANNADAPVRADPYLIALLEASYDVTVFAPATATAEGAQALRDAAEGMDVVFISESIGSSSVLFDENGDGTATFVLQDSPVSVISFEAYMWEDAGWVGREQFTDFGNTGRNEVPEAVQDPLTHLHVQAPDHPIAAGLSGQITVYDAPYSANWANVSADATVVTSVLADGSFPSDFVYDEGDTLADGSVTPGKRIGIFLGQAANLLVEPDAGGLRYAYLSPDGRKLISNAVAYAVGTPETGGGEPGGGASEITGITITANGLVIEGSGTVSSAAAVDGPYTGSIDLPATITADQTAQFYRAN